MSANPWDSGVRLPPMDLLISALCIHHKVPLVTFDVHFKQAAKISRLEVEILIR